METEIIKLGSLDSEIRLNFVRSSGPGGQNVNKVSSKAELRFNVSISAFLNEEQKIILLSKLKLKINDEGDLILTCQTSRSQLENKELVIVKFYNLLNKALKPVKPRKATRPTRASKEKRLEEKRVVSEKKERRRDLF
jgi:ribosome-associated protein